MKNLHFSQRNTQIYTYYTVKHKIDVNNDANCTKTGAAHCLPEKEDR